jgi:hypothetical protein
MFKCPFDGLCGFHARRILDEPIADHVAHVMMFPLVAGKVMHRFQIYNRIHAEDVGLSLISFREYVIRFMDLSVPIRDLSNDHQSHLFDHEVSVEIRLSPFISTNCFLLRAGFAPWS